MTKFPMQAVVVSTFRLAGFRCSKLLLAACLRSSYRRAVSALHVAGSGVCALHVAGSGEMGCQINVSDAVNVTDVEPDSGAEPLRMPAAVNVGAVLPANAPPPFRIAVVVNATLDVPVMAPGKNVKPKGSTAQA